MRQSNQAAIIENKRLGAALAFIREQQLFAANPNGAARRHRAAAISATLVSSRSAERRYEPSGLMPAR